MLFNSLPFLIFFPAVLLPYFIMPAKLKPFWLLAASYFFYMCWNPAYVLLILFSTVATYIAGRLMEKGEQKRKKAILATVIIMNLALLFFFKYWDFALANLNRVLGLIHLQAVESPFSLLLPVGISFYTFQSLGYAIDIYRGKITAEKNFIIYALFVSFFPQLVAGPIERSSDLLPQIREVGKKRLWTREGIVSGFGMML